VQITEKQLYLRNGAKLPKQLSVHGQPVNADWLSLSEDVSEVEKLVRTAGWHFFWLTEHVEGWGIATTKEAAAEAAVRKALKQVEASRNMAEVLHVSHSSLLGLEFCKVRLAARHIQEEMILSLTPSVGLISTMAKPEKQVQRSSTIHELAA